MGVNSRQPLAEGKGVHREVESEGSWKQTSALRNTNHIRHIRWGEMAIQIEAQRLFRHRSVNVAGTWRESKWPYHGRSHGRADVFFFGGMDNNCGEKSAETIVAVGKELRRRSERTHKIVKGGTLRRE